PNRSPAPPGDSPARIAPSAGAWRGRPRRSPGASTRKGLANAAVDGERASRGLRRTVGGEEERRLGHVLGQDAHPEQVALAVEVLEVLDRDPLGRRALPPHV